MPEAPTPPGERGRLAALHDLDILDTEPEQAFDDLAQLAATITGCPVALISFVDEDRQWFKSRVGLELTETARVDSFCAHAIVQPDRTLIVHDATTDERFGLNRLVTGEPRIRFYAGAPLVTGDGRALGTLCVIDHEPTQLTTGQLDALERLARQVVSQLEFRRVVTQLREFAVRQERYHEQLEAVQRRLAKNVARMARRSVTDPLTGLLNRRAALDALGDEVARFERYGQPVSVVMLDVDHFKRVNDTFGHPVGDAVLRGLAEVLEAEARATDIVSRFGGEEFLIVLRDTEAEGAASLAERFRAAVAAAPIAEVAVTVSGGVATAVPRHGDVDALVTASDRAMYEAKAAGRNRVVIATPAAPREGRALA